MKRTLAIVILLSAGLGLGCYNGNVARKGNVALHIGQAKSAATQRMIADPSAGERNTAPIEGLDAPTAEGVIDNYHHNEKAETQERKARERQFRDQ